MWRGGSHVSVKPQSNLLFDEEACAGIPNAQILKPPHPHMATLLMFDIPGSFEHASLARNTRLSPNDKTGIPSSHEQSPWKPQLLCLMNFLPYRLLVQAITGTIKIVLWARGRSLTRHYQGQLNVWSVLVQVLYQCRYPTSPAHFPSSPSIIVRSDEPETTVTV